MEVDRPVMGRSLTLSNEVPSLLARSHLLNDDAILIPVLKPSFYNSLVASNLELEKVRNLSGSQTLCAYLC